MALPLLIALGAAATVGGGIAGAIERSNANADAKRMIEEAIAEYKKAGMPPDTSLPIILKEFTQQGIITPAVEQEIKMESSKVSEVQEAPELRDAQMQALHQLGQTAQGGLRPEDRAAFNQLRDELIRQQEGKRQQILQSMAARGVGGSGAELAAQLQASQTGANEAAQRGDALSAQASQRALQALGQYGTMAGQVRGQEFDINRQRAEAADALQRFNIENARQVQTRNIGAQNVAQQLNLGEQQRIADANVQQANQERLRQDQARQAYWKNLQDYYSGLAGFKTGQATQRRAEGDAAAKQWQGVGSGLGSALGSAGMSTMQQTKMQPMVQQQPEQSDVNDYFLQKQKQDALEDYYRNAQMNQDFGRK